MKRSGPLTRKTPLKRSSFKRSKPRPNPAGSDKKHLAWIRLQPCCRCGRHYDVQAHHITTGRGLGQKTSDRETIPLCLWCHDSFHNARGLFYGWDKAVRRAWQLDMVSMYAPGGVTV